MSSGFLKHLILWCFFIPLLAVFTLPIFFDVESYEVHDSEFSVHEKLLGIESHDKAMNNAREFYKKVIQPQSKWLCSTSFKTGINDQGMDAMISKSNKSRCQAMYRGIYRFNVELKFIFGLLVLAIAAFYDGSMQRLISKHEFGYSNPAVFNFVTHGIIAGLGLVFVGIFLPIDFGYIFYILYSFAIVGFSWVSAKNFQTGA